LPKVAPEGAEFFGPPHYGRTVSLFQSHDANEGSGIEVPHASAGHRAVHAAVRGPALWSDWRPTNGATRNRRKRGAMQSAISIARIAHARNDSLAARLRSR
jgi:hypothetical protein